MAKTKINETMKDVFGLSQEDIMRMYNIFTDSLDEVVKKQKIETDEDYFKVVILLIEAIVQECYLQFKSARCSKVRDLLWFFAGKVHKKYVKQSHVFGEKDNV